MNAIGLCSNNGPIAYFCVEETEFYCLQPEGYCDRWKDSGIWQGGPRRISPRGKHGRAESARAPKAGVWHSNYSKSLYENRILHRGDPADTCGDDLRRDTVCGRTGKGNLGDVTDALRKLKKYVKKGLTLTRERAIIWKFQAVRQYCEELQKRFIADTFKKCDKKVLDKQESTW